MKRTIDFAPEYQITKSGEVWHNGHRVYPSGFRGKFNLEHLVVSINGERTFVWNLLSHVWYGDELPLTRDGSLLRWNEDNVFVLRTRDLSPESRVFDLSEIQFVWYLYAQSGVWCYQMAEKGGFLLTFSVDQFVGLVRDILKVSVK